MKRLLATIAVVGVLTGCTVDPARYRVTDKYGNTNCLNAGDYAVAQAMQDMYAIIVKTGKFEIQSRVSAADAIGPDVCTKF
jgi:hypothetical protein